MKQAAICFSGKRKSGKSFVCNLLARYLESKKVKVIIELSEKFLCQHNFADLLWYNKSRNWLLCEFKLPLNYPVRLQFWPLIPDCTQVVVCGVSDPLKEEYAALHGIDAEELKGDGLQKEVLRKEMVLWSEDLRKKDHGYFCRWQSCRIDISTWKKKVD